MSAKCGRLEGHITVPTGGWEADFVNGAGTVTVTIPADRYTPSELVTEINTQIDGHEDMAISISNGEQGTGRVTITNSGGDYSVTWTDADMGTALGFAGNISTTTSDTTGAASAIGIWLPIVEKYSMYGDVVITGGGGSLVTDCTSTVGPTGQVYTQITSRHRQHRRISWMGVALERALRNYETVENQSYESFALAVMYDCPSFITPGDEVVFRPDAAQSEAVTGRLLWPSDLDIPPFVDAWVGRWNIELPVLVVEDS